MNYIIETKNLTKKFKNKLALNNVNMHIKKGDIYGFIGKNGAGKTTTMKLILGLIKPTEGSIIINGSTNLNNERLKIGSLIEAPGLYGNVNAYENMKRFSCIFGGNNSDITQILNLVGLDSCSNKLVKDYSLGMKQRLGIAIALLGNPEILILDEPINGLDPAGIKDIRNVILKLNKEKNITFIISSHLLDELSKITTTYGIINNGVLVEEVGAEELNRRCLKNIRITVSEPTKAIKILKKAKLINNYEIQKNSIMIYDNNKNTALINSTLVNNNISVNELTHNENAFEMYFVERI